MMIDTTDFLIRYDTAETAEERGDLLSDEFANEIERNAFQTAIDDPFARAMFEMEYNGSIRFEDYAPLYDAGLVFNLNEFYPRLFYGEHHFKPIPDVSLTPAGRIWTVDITDTFDIDRFIAPYIQGYLWRSTAGGIVASRDPLNDALEIGDVDVLRLIKNPETGREYLPVEHPQIWDMMVDQTPIKDIDEARRLQFKWWADPDRTTTLHDLSRQPPGVEYFSYMNDDSYDGALRSNPALTYHDHYMSRCRTRA